MSQTQPTSPSSNFKLNFDDALKAYKKRTKNDLLKCPLAEWLKTCDSATSILTVLKEPDQELNQSQGSNIKWLDPTVNVLLAFSESLGEGVGSLFSPAKVIFTGFGILLSTAKNVRADQDSLFEMFERIEAFFRRLDIYTKVVPTEGMVDTIKAILVEILNIVAIATSRIKQGRMKKYTKKLFKKLIGNNEIEDALKRLDRLTQEEARMASAEQLKIANAIDDEVREISGNVLVIGDRVAGVDDRVAGVDEHVAGVADKVACVDHRVKDVDDKVVGVDDRVKGVNERVDERVIAVDDHVKDVDDKVKTVDDKLVQVIDDGKEAIEGIQQAADGVDRTERNKLQQDLRKWLSPSDPSTNHNIACNAHHEGTATWFFEGRTYKEWKSSGPESLLWIHGKPGSGKSILCSTIIEDVKAMCNASQASMAYFYFDFRDINKQHWRDLVPSLLTQLSTESNSCYDILSRLYSKHEDGAQQPNDDALKECLMKMLTALDGHPIYLIMDALDECPDTSGLPSPRDQILQLLKELADLQIASLRICVTSRPEVDISDFLEPLTSCRVSLHDESGQKQDIADYVRSVVYSESHMRRWKKEDKEFVIETLSERADGMFRWIFCQLMVLRQCLPSSVRSKLNELPESLDMTYERILKEIRRPNRRLAQHVLQCLVVAVRSLRVEELAEVLAVDFDDVEGIPRLKPDWRWEDQERALLSACSSLIAIVEADGSRVVQFSHFSVKEFLASPRLAAASGEVSNYYIDLEAAHTILGQACLAVLLQIQDDVDGHTPEDHPLARYAAEHWTTHAQFGEVSSRLHKGMEYLFDTTKPHFKVWLTLFDIDTFPDIENATFSEFALRDKLPGSCLYYASLYGFHDLVEHLIAKHWQDVNVDGGHYKRPLVAALAGDHFQTADLLRQNGADLNVQGQYGIYLLHAAAGSGNFELVRILVGWDPTSINARDERGWTPLYFASGGHNFKGGSVVRLLLEHGAEINAQAHDGQTPLHHASWFGSLEVVRLLVEHGTEVNAQADDGQTPLYLASRDGPLEVVRLLVEHGAEINAQTNNGQTPLHHALQYQSLEVVRLLVEHGAEINAQADGGQTPLHKALLYRLPKRVRLLDENSAEINAQTNDGETPLHQASQYQSLEVVRLLVEHGADINAQTNDGQTPLHQASLYGSLEVVRLLVEHDVEINAQNNDGQTPLHQALLYGSLEAVILLVEHGAEINAQTKDGHTPLHLSLQCRSLEVVRLLVGHGAEINAQTNDGQTPLHLSSQSGSLEVVRLLVEHDAEINSQTNDGQTPLHKASKHGRLKVVRLLIEHGAEINTQTNDGQTPLHHASRHGSLKVVRLLVEHGADVQMKGNGGNGGKTALQEVADLGYDDIVKFLQEHGAK